MIPPGSVEEFRFAPPRRFRFDFAWIPQKVALEVNGGVWVHGRHNRGAGYIRDMEKLNLAASLGWRVFQFTPQQVQRMEHVPIILEALK